MVVEGGRTVYFHAGRIGITVTSARSVRMQGLLVTNSRGWGLFLSYLCYHGLDLNSLLYRPFQDRSFLMLPGFLNAGRIKTKASASIKALRSQPGFTISHFHGSAEEGWHVA